MKRLWFQRLKLSCLELLPIFAFSFNLRRYIGVTVAEDRLSLEPPPEAVRGRAGGGDGTTGGDCDSDGSDGDGSEDMGGWNGRLFRLSLGTGGTGVMVSAAAAAEWDMVSRTAGLQPGGRGLHSSSSQLNLSRF